LLKHLKKILAALALGFIAFAPPGTLIIIAIFLLGLFGKTWLIVGIVFGLVLTGIYAYIFRARLLKSRFLKTISRKLKIKIPGK
jgi:H+/gluconate symporter-like permease